MSPVAVADEVYDWLRLMTLCDYCAEFEYEFESGGVNGSESRFDCGCGCGCSCRSKYDWSAVRTLSEVPTKYCGAVQLCVFGGNSGDSV